MNHSILHLPQPIKKHKPMQTTTIQTRFLSKVAPLQLMNDLFFKIAMNNRANLFLDDDTVMDFYLSLKKFLNRRYPEHKSTPVLQLHHLQLSKFRRNSLLSYLTGIFFGRPVSELAIGGTLSIDEWSLCLKNLQDIKKLILAHGEDLRVELLFEEDYVLKIEATYKKYTKAVTTVSPEELNDFLLNKKSLDLTFDRDSVSYIFVENDIMEIEKDGYTVSKLGDICIKSLDKLKKTILIKDENRVQLLWYILNYPRIIDVQVSIIPFPDL